MAEFLEVVKKYNEMCKDIDCRNGLETCPIRELAFRHEMPCGAEILTRFPSEAEKIVMNYEKRKYKTNADVFEEFFGISINNVALLNDTKRRWWTQEYKEPKEVE